MGEIFPRILAAVDENCNVVEYIVMRYEGYATPKDFYNAIRKA